MSELIYRDKLVVDANGNTVLKNEGSIHGYDGKAMASNHVALSGGQYVDLPQSYDDDGQGGITLPANSYNTRFDPVTKTFKQLSSTGDVGENLVDPANFHNYNIYPFEKVVRTNDEYEVIADDGPNCLLYGTGTGITLSFVKGDRFHYGFDVLSSTDNTLFIESRSSVFGGTDFLNRASNGTNYNKIGIALNDGNGKFYIGASSATEEAVLSNIRLIKLLQVSTHHGQDEDFSLYFPHDAPLTQADLDALNANPNLLYDVWFNGVSLPSGFSKANMGYSISGGALIPCFVEANEGVAGGATLTNLANFTETYGIQGYTDAVRTTYLNTQIGASSLLLEKDVSGRTVGTTPITTGNGKHIIFPLDGGDVDYTAGMCLFEATGSTWVIELLKCDHTREDIGTPKPPSIINRTHGFADNMKAVAKKLIDKYGMTMRLVEVQQGGYDPMTGKNLETKIMHDTKGFISRFDNSLVVAGVVNMDDLKILCYNSNALLPTKDWKVMVQGVEMTIISVQNVITTQDDFITYGLQVRT